jgi:succinate dehydrogenase flavin-adding protein (antitoxin of CptAB toxin-antitoxin module)
VLKHNGALLPPAALFIIRYHSFYALHQHGAYQQLLDEQDRQLLPWLVGRCCGGGWLCAARQSERRQS